MGTRAPPLLLLLLLLGCWAQGPRGPVGSPLSLWSPHDEWVPNNVTTLHLRCQRPGPGPKMNFSLRRGPAGATSGPLGATPGPAGATWELVQTIESRADHVTFSIPPVTGVYVCHCGDPPGPPSNTVEVVVTDPLLPPPRLWLPPLQELPVPPHTNVSLFCGGPPSAATFRLYRGGPGGRVGQQWVQGGGGPAHFPLGPLAPPDEGAYVCTYSPPSGGVSMPSSPLMLLVQNGTANPKDPNWPGCKYWKGDL